jgi:hypothetical protein
MSTNPYRPPENLGERPPERVSRNLGRITLWTSIVFALQAVLMFGMGLSLALVPSLLSTLADPEATPTGHELLFGLASVAWIALLIPGIVLFCVWVRWANMNAEDLVPSGLEFTPGWAVGWFFVPFANLYKPYHVVAEIYRASNPDSDPDYWKISEVPSFIPLWWVSYIAFNVIRNVNSRIPAGQGEGLAVVEFALGCFSAAMVVVVVRSIHRLQRKKAGA